MWTSDIADSDLITEAKADFLLAEAKAQLAATVDDAAGLAKAGIYLLGGLLTITSGLVGVLATQFESTQSLANQRWGSILPLALLAVYLSTDAAIVMWSALSVKALDHCGNQPRFLATKDLFALELRLIKFAEAASYQSRLENNRERNERIGERINLAIKLVCLAPFLYLGALVATRFIFAV